MNELAVRQIVRATGFAGGKVLVDAARTFWTLTAWQNEQAMRDYRNNGAHFKAMPKLKHWCDEASVAHWSQDAAELPDWSEAHRRMIEQGRFSKVNHPSPHHLSQQITEPRIPARLERSLVPKG